MIMLTAPTGNAHRRTLRSSVVNVDLGSGTLQVPRSVVVAPSGLAVKATKTDRGRVVALHPVGVAVPSQHQERAASCSRQAGGQISPDSYVSRPKSKGSSPFSPDNVRSFFIRVRSDSRARTVRLHDLRHFTATQLIGADVDARTVAGRLAIRSTYSKPCDRRRRTWPGISSPAHQLSIDQRRQPSLRDRARPKQILGQYAARDDRPRDSAGFRSDRWRRVRLSPASSSVQQSAVDPARA